MGQSTVNIWASKPNCLKAQKPTWPNFRKCPIDLCTRHIQMHSYDTIAESATFACQTVSIFMDTTVTFFPNSFIYYNLFLFN